VWEAWPLTGNWSIFSTNSTHYYYKWKMLYLIWMMLIISESLLGHCSGWVVDFWLYPICIQCGHWLYSRSGGNNESLDKYDYSAIIVQSAAMNCGMCMLQSCESIWSKAMVFLKDMQHAKIYITVAIKFSALELHCCSSYILQSQGLCCTVSSPPFSNLTGFQTCNLVLGAI